MVDEFTIGELFYCLIQDMQDYLMHIDNPKLEHKVEIVDRIHCRYNLGMFDDNDLEQLNAVLKYFKQNQDAERVDSVLNFKQFAIDLEVIIERLNDERSASKSNKICM